jgi:hypothetical protein
MLRSSTSAAISLRLVVLLPCVMLAAACTDSEDGDGTQGGDAGDSSTSGGLGSSAGETSSGGDASGGGTTAAAGEAATAGETSAAGAAGVGVGPAPVDLGTASNYAILAKSAISNVPTSKVTGDLGLSPAAASYVTGFSLVKAGTSWTSAQVVGHVFAANNDPPTPITLTTAVGDMQLAYTDAAGRKSPDFLNLGAGTIGGLTLAPGLYKWTSTLTIPSDVTLEGGANDVWIFQVSGDLKLSAEMAMVLSGGAEPANIFWQVAGAVDLGATSHAEGIVLSKTAIKLQTGASLNGRLLAQTAVTLAKATVTAP